MALCLFKFSWLLITNISLWCKVECEHSERFIQPSGNWIYDVKCILLLESVDLLNVKSLGIWVGFMSHYLNVEGGSLYN